MSNLRITYAILAVLGLIVPWYFNVQSLTEGNFWNFLAGTVSTAGARSFTSDLLIAATAGFIWIVAESRRLQIRYGWTFVPIGIFVSFAFAFPLFLCVRQGRLQSLGRETSPAPFSPSP